MERMRECEGRLRMPRPQAKQGRLLSSADVFGCASVLLPFVYVPWSSRVSFPVHFRFTRRTLFSPQVQPNVRGPGGQYGGKCRMRQLYATESPCLAKMFPYLRA